MHLACLHPLLENPNILIFVGWLLAGGGAFILHAAPVCMWLRDVPPEVARAVFL